MPRFAVLVISLALCGVASADAATLFFDDFNSGYAGWSAIGDVASDDGPALVPNSVRLRETGQIWRTVPTTGASRSATERRGAAARI